MMFMKSPPQVFFDHQENKWTKKPIPFQDALKVEVRQSGWCLYNLSAKIAVSYSDRLSLRTFHSEFSTSVTRPLDIYRFCPPQSKKKRTPTVAIFRWSAFHLFLSLFVTGFSTSSFEKTTERTPQTKLIHPPIFFWAPFSFGKGFPSGQQSTPRLLGEFQHSTACGGISYL